VTMCGQDILDRPGTSMGHRIAVGFVVLSGMSPWETELFLSIAGRPERHSSINYIILDKVLKND